MAKPTMKQLSALEISDNAKVKHSRVIKKKLTEDDVLGVDDIFRSGQTIVTVRVHTDRNGTIHEKIEKYLATAENIRVAKKIVGHLRTDSLSDAGSVAAKFKKGATSVRSRNTIKKVLKAAGGALGANLAKNVIQDTLIPKVTSDANIQKVAGYTAAALVSIGAIGYGQEDVGYGAAAATCATAANEIIAAVSNRTNASY